MSDVPDRVAGDPAIDRIHATSELWPLLSGLPRRQRTVLVLRYYEQQSAEEIAALLDISRGTVRGQAARALEKLRSQTAAPEETTSGRQR